MTDRDPRASVWPRLKEFTGKVSVRVSALCVAMLLALLAWAFSSPVGSSPDDDFHIANVYCIHDAASCRSDDAVWPDPDGTPWWPPDPADRLPTYASLQEVYPDLWGYDAPRKLPCFILNGYTRYAPDAKVPADCLNSEDQASNRPQSLDDLDYYPTWQYRLLSVFTQETLRESVAAWRVVIVLLALMTTVASVALSPPSWRRPISVAWLVSSIPLGLFLLSSHNPSALAVIGAVAAVGPGVWLLSHEARGIEVLPRLLLIAWSLVLMLAGRSEGLVFVIFAVVFILVLGLRRPSTTTVAVSAGLICMSALVAWLFLPGFWAKVTRMLGLDTANSSQSFWDALSQSPGVLTGSYSSPLGWLEVFMPNLVTVVAGAAYWGAIALGLAVMTWRKAIAIGLVVAALILGSVATYVADEQYAQVRYYLPLIYLLVVATLSPVAGRPMPTWSRSQWWALSVALAVANAIALLHFTVRYVSGVNPGSTSPWALAAARTPDWWWGAWLGPFSNWVVGSLAMAVVLALLPSLLMRLERNHADDPALIVGSRNSGPNAPGATALH